MANIIDLNQFNVEISTPAPFTGATANTRGDKDGTNVNFKLFDVTGEVLVRIYGIVTTTLVGAGTLEVGVAGSTAGLIAQVADATTLAAGDFYNLATSTVIGTNLLSNILGPYIISNGLDIIETSGTADITAGQIYYVCLWQALSPNGRVKAVAPRGN